MRQTIQLVRVRCDLCGDVFHEKSGDDVTGDCHWIVVEGAGATERHFCDQCESAIRAAIKKADQRKRSREDVFYNRANVGG